MEAELGACAVDGGDVAVEGGGGVRGPVDPGGKSGAAEAVRAEGVGS